MTANGLVPVRNFGTVRNGIYRSAQPQYIYEYEWLRHQVGLKTIVNLRKENNMDERMAKLVGIKNYLRIEVADHNPPTIEQALQYYATIKSIETPALIHCQHGHGRTSTFSVITKMAFGMSAEKAIEDERNRFGYEFKHASQRTFILEFEAHLRENKIIKRGKLRTLFDLVAFPVHYIADMIAKNVPHSRDSIRLYVGFAVAFIGVCVSKIPCDGLVHYVFDFCGYAIHGAGLIPAFKVIETRIFS